MKKLTPDDIQKLEIGDKVGRITQGHGIVSKIEEDIVTDKTDKMLTVSVPDSLYKAKKEDIKNMAKVMELQSVEEIDAIFEDDIPPSWDFDLSTGKEITLFNPFGLTSYLVTE